MWGGNITSLKGLGCNKFYPIVRSLRHDVEAWWWRPLEEASTLKLYSREAVTNWSLHFVARPAALMAYHHQTLITTGSSSPFILSHPHPLSSLINETWARVPASFWFSRWSYKHTFLDGNKNSLTIQGYFIIFYQS